MLRNTSCARFVASLVAAMAVSGFAIAKDMLNGKKAATDVQGTHAMSCVSPGNADEKRSLGGLS